jgi:hypothetical protein
MRGGGLKRRRKNGYLGKKGGLLLLFLGVRGLDWKLFRGGWRRISNRKSTVCLSIYHSLLESLSKGTLQNVEMEDGERERG